MSERESIEFDVLIIGAGPSGLATAINLAKCGQQQGKNLEICVLEKGSEVGAHILSGAVIETRALDELIPNWQELDPPIKTKARSDSFLYLTEKSSFKLPTPKQMHNKNNYIVSLGNVCKWLAEYAENLGVQIFAGFAAQEVIYNDNDEVVGIKTGESGIGKDGAKTPNYEPGMGIFAKNLVIAEGCRGSIAKQIIDKYNLDENSKPQTYGLGIKELWEVPEDIFEAGNIMHTIGWPLDSKTYGGSFLYHLEPNIISIGFVVGLDYQNPYLSPFNEFQRFKHHPVIKKILEKGRRISYGARTINEGGLQAIPKLNFPGGLIVGCSAGFLNVPKIKGTHLAMKSGMLAAESIINNTDYAQLIKNSWIYSELKQVRNIRPGFKWGLIPGLLNAAFETYVSFGKSPWTLKNHVDHTATKPKDKCMVIDYPKPDNKLSFDRLSSLTLANVYHEENQPAHLKLKDPDIAISYNYEKYDSPEQRYCPAGVYEIVKPDDDKPYLQINAQNCVHCKACDIKDLTQNITWTVPEGTGGPNYTGM